MATGHMAWNPQSAGFVWNHNLLILDDNKDPNDRKNTTVKLPGQRLPWW